MQKLLGLTAALMVSAGAAVAENWDMPMAYADSNYHSQTGKAFASCVGTATGGDITITVHAGGSLFKGNEIKRAVQTGQAPIGERLLSAHQNENPIFGIDSIPFLETTFDQSQALWDAARPAYETLLDEPNLVLLYATPWPPTRCTWRSDATTARSDGVKLQYHSPWSMRSLHQYTGRPHWSSSPAWW